MTTLRWGILGAARIARALIPAIREAGGEVVALGVRDPASEHARAFSREWDVPLVGGYRQVIGSDVDAVYNPLPNDLHLPWTLAALQAGKHALTEKPFTLNAAEAGQLASEAQGRGLTLMEAFAPRFHPYQARIREIVQSGELGELRAVHASSGFTLTNPDDYRWNANQGGGALYDVGTYCVNFARFLLGEPQAALARARWSSGGIDLGLSGVLEYPGVLVSVETGFDWGNAAAQNITLTGSAGTLVTDRVSNGHLTEVQRLSVRTASGERTEDIPPFNGYVGMVKHFQEAAQGQAAPLYPPADAVAQARVLDALYQSARTGERVILRESAT